jgi:hypothetical protein
MELVGDRDQSSVDRHACSLEVDVLPAETEELASPHPGGGEHPEGGKQPMTSCSLQKRL